MFAGRFGTRAVFEEVAVTITAFRFTSLSSTSSTVNLIAAVGVSSATVTSRMLLTVGRASLTGLTVTSTFFVKAPPLASLTVNAIDADPN